MRSNSLYLFLAVSQVKLLMTTKYSEDTKKERVLLKTRKGETLLTEKMILELDP